MIKIWIFPRIPVARRLNRFVGRSLSVVVESIKIFYLSRRLHCLEFRKSPYESLNPYHACKHQDTPTQKDWKLFARKQALKVGRRGRKGRKSYILISCGKSSCIMNANNPPPKDLCVFSFTLDKSLKRDSVSPQKSARRRRQQKKTSPTLHIIHIHEPSQHKFKSHIRWWIINKYR